MKSKTRESDPLVLAKEFFVTNLVGTILAQGSGDTFWDSKIESISYGAGRNRYNPCTHYKWTQEVSMYPLTQFRRWTTSDSEWDHSSNPGTGPYDNEDTCRNWVRSKVDPPDWRMFSQRAIEAMTPTMETGFSLGNFMYEIREVKSLLKWWNKGRSWFKNISDVSLNYSFGLRPFISDLLELARGLYDVRDRLAELKSGAGKLQVRHYSEEEKFLEYEGSYFTNDGEIRRDYEIHVPSLIRTATMTYVYQMPDIDEDLFFLYGLLDSLGLNLNPRIIWDAYPLTFVVDWFFNVGEFLSQLRKKWIPVSIHIKDFGVSEKYNYWAKENVQKLGKVDGPLAPLREFWGKSYTRRPYKVDDRCFYPTPSGGLTLRKFYLGSLLITQRII